MISYKHLDAFTYEVRFDYYFSCGNSFENTSTGPSYLSAVTINYTNSNSLSHNLLLPITEVNLMPMVCTDSVDSVNTCIAGSLGDYGYHHAVYLDTFDFAEIDSVPSDEGYLLFTACCMAASNNIIGQPGFVARASFDPFTQNSSPSSFASEYPIVFLEGETYDFSMAMTDSDGDSLVYTLDTNINSFSWFSGFGFSNSAPGYSALNPVDGLTFDEVNGTFHLEAIIPSGSIFSRYFYTIRIEDWDPIGDTLKGFLDRTLQLVVFPDTLKHNPILTSGIVNPSGIYSVDSITIDVLSNEVFSFELTYSDSNALDSLSALIHYDSSQFDLSISQSGVNPATFHVTGKALEDFDYGSVFSIDVRDDQCNIRGMISMPIFVRTRASGLDTISLCEGTWETVEYFADSSVQWTVLSGDTIDSGTNFNCLNTICSEAELSPDTNTTYVVEQFMTNGLVVYDTFTIVLTQEPDISISQIGSACAGDSFVLHLQVTSADSFQIHWTDSIGIIMNDSVDSTTVFSNQAGTYEIPYKVEINQTCFVEDTVSIIIHPTPLWGGWNGLPSQICLGDSFQLVSVASQSYSYTPATYLTSGAGDPYCALYDSITYSISYLDTNGCGGDTNHLFQPDSNYLLGQAFDSNGLAVVQGMVYMIAYDASNDSVYAADSAGLDANGFFLFKPYLQEHFIKVVPDSASYPGLIPSYFDSVAVVQDASFVSTSYCDTSYVSIPVLNGANPGGSGFIGGIVTQGAARGVGDPVKHLSVLLYDESQATYMWTSTNDDGYFKFEGLASGSYRVWVDKWGVKNWIAPLFEIGESDVLDSLQFTLYSDRLVHETPAGITEKTKEFKVFPNPVSSRLHIESDSWPLSFVVYDLVGRVVFESYSHSESELDLSSLEPGSYILHSTDSDGEQHSSTLIKSAR